MSIGPDHFCPGCGAPQKRFDRYPWYFCGACLATASDGNGRRLVFGNSSIFGGFEWAYADDPDNFDDKATFVICLIRQRRVVVHEARFGGIVAEPTASLLPGAPSDRVVYLTEKGKPQAAAARLRPREGRERKQGRER